MYQKSIIITGKLLNSKYINPWKAHRENVKMFLENVGSQKLVDAEPIIVIESLVDWTFTFSEKFSSFSSSFFLSTFFSLSL